MDVETVVLIGAMFTAAWKVAKNSRRKVTKPKRVHRWWVRPWIQDRGLKNQVNTAYKLQRQLAMTDHEEFFRMLRMPPHVFEFILNRIRHKIYRQDTQMRNAVPVEERLSVTLKFLATGENSISLSQNYRLGPCTVNRIIHDTCAAVIEVLAPEFVKTPDTPEEWGEVISQFQHRWNYPGCIGAVDGKHVRIKKPAGSGSTYYNYKGFFSIILMAVANGNYEFIYCNAGGEGSIGDAGYWKVCDFPKAIAAGKCNLPQSVRLTEGKTIPCHFVADDAFPMGPNLLKPHPHRNLSVAERVYNYRLSRARRIIENVFGIITSRFLVLRNELRFTPEHCINVVLAVCVLHNILRRMCGKSYIPPGTLDTEDINYNVVAGDWREGENLTGLRPSTTRNPVSVAKKMRNDLTEYFVSEQGEVPWQYGSVETAAHRIVASL